MSFRSILIVDGHIEIIQLMTDFLEMENYKVYSAKNAEEAESLLRRVEIDCIILDIMMPVRREFALFKKIRKLSEVRIYL